MKTPAEIQFDLQRRLLALAKDGRVPQVVGLHSVSAEDGEAHVMYDLMPGGEVFFFSFELPVPLTHEELQDLASWIAWSDADRTVH